MTFVEWMNLHSPEDLAKLLAILDRLEDDWQKSAENQANPDKMKRAE